VPRVRFSSRGLTNPGLMRCWIDLPPQSTKFLAVFGLAAASG
jgi:hypothetical protein